MFLSSIILLLLYPLVLSSSVSSFELVLSDAYEAKDGVYKSYKTINGISPGPPIIVDEDAWVEVTVHNRLESAAAIHFHGVLQLGTPWSDGVPGITQAPIATGATFKYKFHVRDQSGCLWYHSHYRGHLSDGIYGLFYIRPRNDRARPYHLVSADEDQLELITRLEQNPSFLVADDTFKQPMDEVMMRMNQYGIDPLCIRSILVNGKGRVFCHPEQRFRQLASKNPFLDFIPYFDCLGCLRDDSIVDYKGSVLDHYALEFPGYSNPCRPTNSPLHVHYTNDTDWQYINILNAGGQYTKLFSIDDHEFYVVAIDGIFVHPQRVSGVVLPVGSRFTILVETRREEHENTALPFLIRFTATHAPQFIEGLALLVYGSPDETNNPASESRLLAKTNLDGYLNGARFTDLDGRMLKREFKAVWPQQTRPYESRHVLQRNGAADVTFPFYLHRYEVVQFSMFRDGTKLAMDMDKQTPLLESVLQGDFSGLRENKAILQPEVQQGQVVDLILDNHKHINHPIHLHGHYVHVISFSDHENFPYRTVEEAKESGYPNLNLENPPYLDVVLVPVGGHVVLRFVADNPGVWLVHCHNVGHLMGGMGAVLLERLGEIAELKKKF